MNQLIAGKEIIKESSETYILKLTNEPALHSNSNHSKFNEYIRAVDDIANNMEFIDVNLKEEVWHYSDILSHQVLNKLVTIGEQYHISIFNLLLLAWGVFVTKLSNQKTTLLNYPVSIRAEKSISGCFINTVILPINLNEKETYCSLISTWQENADFFKHISRLQIGNMPNVKAISCFANSYFAKPMDLIIDGVSLASKEFAQIANSNINIKYRDYQGRLQFSCDIVSCSFPVEFASSLLPRFFNYLSKLLNSPMQFLSCIDLTFEVEKKQILNDFNETSRPYPRDKTLIDLFEEQVEKTPNNIALVFDDIRFTYLELNKKANLLAHYLAYSHQVKPDDLVALLLERNEFLLIAILAILKAGGAYVPLELSYPQERIEYILDDTQVKMILTNELHQDKLKHLFSPGYLQAKVNPKIVDVVIIDSKKFQIELDGLASSNIVTADTSANLAYVIYTSGTTGKPKGVMIEHKSVVNTVHYMKNIYKRSEDKRNFPLKITAFTSYAFDVSVSEFFVPLLQGDELHLLNNTLRQDVLLTGKYINDNQINYVYLPPVLLTNLPRITYPSLKGIIYAGEPCDAETALYWSCKTKLYNYYGPTETSIYATGLQLISGDVSLIGKPIANTSAYVLNIDMNLQPICVVGELYLGGVGVAQGYLNQSELSAERFINNIFQTDKEKKCGTNSRLYKTGDLVRWHPDGNLEYIGRNDFQVKIRGYRIELSEIETILAAYPGIKQAIVMVKNHCDANEAQSSHQFLVGYYVADQAFDEGFIHDYLGLHLPDYMHPNVLVHLFSLPLTTNGKLDRNALPTPDFSRNDNHVPPTNDKEELVCNAFSKILAIKNIGILDDFFKFGGNSIRAISLVSNLQENFNISVADIFNFKTPKRIAKNIPFIKNNFRNNLEKILSDYKNINSTLDISIQFQHKLDFYLSSINQLSKNSKVLSIDNVLLTGATGFLGCNLLHSLLTTTNYNVFLLVRGGNQKESFDRLNHKFKFYFDFNLDHFYNVRLFVYAGDIEKRDLGISKEDYKMLVERIDSVIHSAALTKHYGDYDTFYSINVQATINLLEFAKLTKLKNFHYVSTSSVLNEGYVPNYAQYVFTEDDAGDNLKDRTNIYVKTKYEGEKVVTKYRKHGVNCNIYRVGNLAFISSNCRGQENIWENAFFTRLNCLINLNIVAPEIAIEEISPVDLTAAAIVKLFDKEHTNNSIFHVFNPELYSLGDILTQEETFNIKMVTIDQFINTIINKIDNPKYQKLIEHFLLHRRWLNAPHRFSTNVRILQDRTQVILKQYGFEWTPITSEILTAYLKREMGRDKQD